MSVPECEGASSRSRARLTGRPRTARYDLAVQPARELYTVVPHESMTEDFSR